MTHYEKMRENYEDAVFYLLMDQLANEQGKKYKELNEQLKKAPAFVVPPEVSHACYRTIHKEFSKAHQAEAIRIAGKVFQRVAILIATLTLLITGALAISPELRAYTLNLVIETFDNHANIHFFSLEKEKEGTMAKPETDWLPDGYTCTYQSDDDMVKKFRDEEEHWITFIISPDSVGVDLDTENASVMENVYIGGCQGLYVERPDDNSLIWGDTSEGKVFTLLSDNLDKNAIINIAENISAK